jgi:cell wall-associated protease
MNKFFLFTLMILIGCKSNTYKPVVYNHELKKLKINELKNWQNLDLQKDSIPGISLDRWYKEQSTKKRLKPIVVAVIDSYIDDKHEDLKNQIWVNKNEISNNNIDDDNNGYIDDSNGWNFLGNTKGQSTFRLNYDATRRLRKLLNKNIDTTNFKGNKADSLEYLKIKASLANSKKKNVSKHEEAKYYQEAYVSSFNRLNKIFNNKKYTLVQVDSLFKAREFDADDDLYYDIYFARDFLKTNNNKAWIDLFKEKVEGELTTSLHPLFKENDIIQDRETDITDKNYGNNQISKYANKTWHSTMMSGMIVADRENKIGIEGFGNHIKVMPLVVSSASGNNRDKDIALAIEYAVNNGSKVINMSFGKSDPIYPEWIQNALKYAEKNDVLVIVSAGNSNENLDTVFSYPNDYYNVEDENEYIKNLIIVGGVNHTINEKFMYQFSNFGKKNVDIMAPATDIWSLDPLRKYAMDDGTSFSAALTSGAATLIRSRYPKLTAKQVKDIILESGVKYDIEVIVPGTTDKKVKFSELSKSGGVLNVYNAMLLAEKVSPQKQ